MEAEQLQRINKGTNEAAQRGTMVQLSPLTARELLDHIEAQKRVLEIANQRIEALASRLAELEKQAAAIPASALVDYYYNSWPQNEDALRAAKILDPWMETLRV